MFKSSVEGKAGKFARWGRWMGWPPPFGRLGMSALAHHAEWSLARPHLLSALQGKNRAAAAQAEGALRSLVDPGARDALIDLVLDGKAGERVARLVDQAGYRHSDEGRHLLYLALLGRFEECLTVDPGFHVLRARFNSAPADLQDRIREAVTHASDARANQLLSVPRRQTVLGELTGDEAELLVRVAASQRQWETLFRCCWVLPAAPLARAVKAMREDRWSPEDPDRSGLLTRLVALVEEIGQPPEPTFRSLALGPLLQGWLARGEAWERSGQPEEAWRRRLSDSADPADQVAALAALRQRGALDGAALRQAGRSPHWPVRFVAAALGGQIDPQDQGGRLWLERLAPLLSADALWGGRPCDLARGGLEALRSGLAALPDRRAAGGLLLVEAVFTHYAGRQPEVDPSTCVVVGEDTFEIQG